MTPPNFPPKKSWRIKVPRSFLKVAPEETLRQIIATFDMMVEQVGTGMVDVSGEGDMPLWAQALGSVDQ